MLEFWGNQIFLTCLFGWAIAHLIKYILALLEGSPKSLKEIFDSGGFPSGHTTLVTALFMSVGFETNWEKVATTTAGILAIIVIYDAVNVRFNAGLMAKAINQMRSKTKQKIKENLGHTYFEAFGGLILGVIVAVLSYQLI